MNKGTRVRFVSKNLGVLNSPHGGSFVPGLDVPQGSEGTYLQAEPRLGEDWHMIEVDIDGETYFCPVHSGHFEVIE